MLEQRFHHQIAQMGDPATRRVWVSKVCPDFTARQVEDAANRPGKEMIHTTHFEVSMKKWSAGQRTRLLLEENATPSFEKKSMTPVTPGGILEEYTPPARPPGAGTRKRKREENAGAAPAPPAGGRGEGGHGGGGGLRRATAPPTGTAGRGRWGVPAAAAPPAVGAGPGPLMGEDIAVLSARALSSVEAGRESASSRVQAIANEAARLDEELKMKYEAALKLEEKIAESERKHAEATQALLAEATRLRREMSRTLTRYEHNQADIQGLQGGPPGSGSAMYDLRSAPASAATTADGTPLNEINERLQVLGQRRLEETEDVLEIAEDDLRRSGRPYLCMDDLRVGG